MKFSTQIVNQGGKFSVVGLPVPVSIYANPKPGPKWVASVDGLMSDRRQYRGETMTQALKDLMLCRGYEQKTFTAAVADSRDGIRVRSRRINGGGLYLY